MLSFCFVFGTHSLCSPEGSGNIAIVNSMAKRKAARKPNKKAKLQPLDKVFRCLFCQHAGVVHCKLDRQEMVSRIECSRCAQHFETKIDHLTEPIDVYSLWIDAAEMANQAGNAALAQSQTRQFRETHDRNEHSGDRTSKHSHQHDSSTEPYSGYHDDDGELPDIF